MAFAQIVAIAVLAILGLIVTGQRVLLGGLGTSVIWFVVFFAVGFVMLAALFAATAAMVSRAEDIGSVTTPVTMLVMIPYFLIIFFNDDPTVLAIMSYVPFSAPVGMPMRVFLGDGAVVGAVPVARDPPRDRGARGVDRGADLPQLAAEDRAARAAGRGAAGLSLGERMPRVGRRRHPLASAASARFNAGAS